MQCTAAQQDEVNPGKLEDQAKALHQINVDSTCGFEESPYEAHAPGATGIEWDPGLGWAGMDDSDAEWCGPRAGAVLLTRTLRGRRFRGRVAKKKKKKPLVGPTEPVGPASPVLLVSLVSP